MSEKLEERNRGVDIIFVGRERLARNFGGTVLKEFDFDIVLKLNRDLGVHIHVQDGGGYPGIRMRSCGLQKALFEQFP